jgi:hypothetical protein
MRLGQDDYQTQIVPVAKSSHTFPIKVNIFVSLVDHILLPNYVDYWVQNG